MWIQALLLLGAAALLTLFVRQWDKVRTRAWKRLAFLAFIVANVYAVLRPEDTTWVAHKLGVGRGTDLIVYAIVVGVAFMAMNTYMRFRSLEKKLTDLARAVAIRDAQLLNEGRRLGPLPAGGEHTGPGDAEGRGPAGGPGGPGADGRQPARAQGA